MTEYEKETAFLKRMMALDHGTETRLLESRLVAAERNDRVVRQAMLGVALLLGLAMAGLGYSAILLPDFPFNRSHLVLKIFLALGLGCGLCLVAYACMWVRCRRFLNRLRDDCRRALEAALQNRHREPDPTACSGPVNEPDWPVHRNETTPTSTSLTRAA